MKGQGMGDIRVKICGLSTAETVAAAVEAGAGYLGFNFIPISPRYVTADQAAALVAEVPPGVAKVGLVMDAEDAVIGEITARVPLDMLQLHGQESPARVAEIRTRYGLPVMKAIGIAGPEDLAKIDDYMPVADQILVDAKPPKAGDMPGGTGLTIDWQLVAGRHWAKPWMLAGGLTPKNVALAIRLSGARQVDVSSGVESAKAVKDPELIRAFVEAAK
jgi:phosphoribosylanthranilate isomerase